MGWTTYEDGTMEWVPDTPEQFYQDYGIQPGYATDEPVYVDDQMASVGSMDTPWYQNINLSGIGGAVSNAMSNPALLATVGGGILGSIGAKQTGTQVSTQAPWEAQQPYLKDLFAKASGALNTSLAFSPQEQMALDAMQQRAMMGSPVHGMGQATAMGILGGIDSNPYLGADNPYLTKSINAASEDAMRNMQPMFAQQQRASGSFGNANLAESQARTAATTLGNIANNARMADYTQQQQLGESDINRRMNLALQSPNLAQSDFNDLEKLYNVGQTRRFDPYATLGKYGSLIQGNYGGVSSSPLYQNKAAEALGGGLLGMQAWNQFNKGQ